MQGAVKEQERILSLDVLRGFAILGILVMNIQHFSMPTAAYSNPTAYGDLEGINRWVWMLSHLLAQEKFMSLFSMLFGAGVLLFNERAMARGVADVVLHYRRMGWLLVFGLMHGYLFWPGDVLVAYSLCGMLVFLFRKKGTRRLLILSGIFFLVPLLISVFMTWSLPHMPEEAKAQMLQSWKPDAETLQHSLETFRGGWVRQMDLRIQETLFMQTGIFFMSIFWRTMAMMLLGMALYKSGAISASMSGSFYRRLALFGLIPGLALGILGTWQNFGKGWSMDYSMFTGHMYNYVGSLGVALGYLALVMLSVQAGWGRRLKALLAKVGRTAFSNYILQTLIATFIFFGHGLGLYGSVERKQQILFVLAIWLVNLVFSSLWLKYFRQGPLEALWRRLTYGPS